MSEEALRVVKLTGDVILSLRHEQLEPGITVEGLLTEVAKLITTKERVLTVLVSGTRTLDDSELVKDLLPPQGVLELSLAVQQLTTFDPNKPALTQLDVLGWMLRYGSEEEQAAACQELRRLVTADKPPIDQITTAGFVAPLVECASGHANIMAQRDAAWALTNIASGSSEQTMAVVKSGGLETFVSLLDTENENLHEQAVWGLGNIAGDSEELRDQVLQAGTVPKLCRLLEAEPGPSVACTEQIIWTISNLCRGSPPPDFALVRPTLPLLSRELQAHGNQVPRDAVWALSYLSSGDEEHALAVLDAGVLPRLVQHHLAGTSDSVRKPVLDTLLNIARWGDFYKEAVVAAEALPFLVELLEHPKTSIRSVCFSLVAHIAAGSAKEIQSVLDAGLLDPFCEEAVNISSQARRRGSGEASRDSVGEAIALLNNVAARGTLEQLQLIAMKVSSVLVGMLQDSARMQSVLHAFQNMLRAGQRHQQEQGLDKNPIVDPLLDAGLAAALEDPETSERAEEILELLMEGDEEED